MELIYVAFGNDPDNPEAVGLKYHDGVRLPPGLWKIRYPNGDEKLTIADDLPPHWLERIRCCVNFGKTLNIPDKPDE